MLRFDLRAGQAAYGQPRGPRGFAFLADHLALATGKCCQKAVKISVAVVFPMKLLGDPVQKPILSGQRLGLFLGAKGEMQRRQAVLIGNRNRGFQQGFAPFWIAQKPLAGGRGEGHRDLQFGVITAARAL